MTLRPPYLLKKSYRCHGQRFDPIFLKICIKEKQPIAKFGIVIQLSTLSTSGQNDG